MTKISKLTSYALSIAMTLSLVLEAPGIAYAQEYAGTTAPVEDNNDIEEGNINEENNSSAEGNNETDTGDNIEENNNSVENVEDVEENEDAGEDNADDNNSGPVNETDAEDDQEDQPEQAVQEDEHVHSYSYEQVDEEKHLAVCLGCGEIIEEPHSFTDGVCNLCSYAQELESDNADEECYIEVEKITALYFNIEDPSEYLFESSYGGGIAYAVESGDGTYDVYVNGAEVIEGDFSGLCNCSCVIFGSGTYTFVGRQYFAGLGSSVGDALVDFTDASLIFESESNLLSGSSVSEIYLPCSLSAIGTVSLDKEYDGFSDSEEYAGAYSTLCNASTDVVFFRLPGSGSKASPLDSVLIWTDDNGVEYYDTDALDYYYSDTNNGIIIYRYDTDNDDAYDLCIITSSLPTNTFAISEPASAPGSSSSSNFKLFSSACHNATQIVFRDPVKANDKFGFFCNLSKLISIVNLENLDTSEVTNMSKMFYYCESLTEIDLSVLDTSNVTDMSDMFSNCSSLTTIDLSSFYTGKVSNMKGMFRQCVFSNIDIGVLDTSNVTNMSAMFCYCESLTEIDLSSLDMSKVANTSYMFYYCGSLTNLNILNTFPVLTDTSDMFRRCDSLSTIDLSTWNCLQLTNVSHMFADCDSLVEIVLPNCLLSDISDASYMFINCSKLKSIINMGSLCISETCNTAEMFYFCKSLIEVDLKNFKNLGERCFYCCDSLYSFKNMDNIESIGYRCFYLHSSSLSQLIFSTDINSTTNQVVLDYDWKSDYRIIDALIYINENEKEYYISQAEKIVTLSFDSSKLGILAYVFNIDEDSSEQFIVICSDSEDNVCDYAGYSRSPQNLCFTSSIKKIIIKNKMKLPPNSSYFFENMNQLEEIIGLENFDASNVTRMDNMFYGCSSLTTFDLSLWNLSNIMQSSSTFQNCTSLQSLNLGNIKIIDSSFAYNCPSLTSISGLDNVTSIDSYAFYRTATKEVPLLYTDINGTTNEVVLNYDWEADNRTIACDSFTIVMPAKIETPVVVPSEGAAYYGTEVEGKVSYKLGSGKKLCVDAVDSFSLVNENNEALTASVTQSDSEFSSDTGTLNSDGDYEDSFTIAIKITGDKLDYNTVYSGKMGFTVSIEDG